MKLRFRDGFDGKGIPKCIRPSLGLKTCVIQQRFGGAAKSPKNIQLIFTQLKAHLKFSHTAFERYYLFNRLSYYCLSHPFR